MGLTARDLMSANVATVDPETTLPELERALIEARVSGFPVVERGRIVGMVSRSDVVRQFCVERSVAENISDYYRELDGRDEPMESLEALGRRVGARTEGLRVKDLMIHDLITVEPDATLHEVAKLLLERHIHRLPVVDDGRLVGIVTSLDLVRLIAEERLGG